MFSRGCTGSVASDTQPKPESAAALAACPSAFVGSALRRTGMRLALVTMGSLGDVHPLLGLGVAMAQRGHHVTFMSNPVFEGLARQHGLHFVGLGTAQQQQDTLGHPKLWHPVDGLGVMWRHMLRPVLWPTVHALDVWRQEFSPDDRQLVVANPVAMGARLAAEAWALPLVSTYTAATMLRTCATPMTLAQWQVPSWFPRWVPRTAWRILDRLKLQPLVLPVLNEMRADLGLPALACSVFGEWMHSPLGGLTLFPRWFAPAALDWPIQVRQGDFPLFDDGTELDDNLQKFLWQGTPPVVVMPGTGQMHASSLFRAAAQALTALGLRGVFLGPVPDDVCHSARPVDLWCGAHQSFSKLLPKARALLHHGGVGSSAQALRAGIPQLLWPQAYDQFDNTMRLQLLGVGMRLPAGAITAEDIEVGLTRLLESDAATCAAGLVKKFTQTTPEVRMEAMCQQLEGWS
jgi:rhamnosyltransferase subunit B